MLQKYEKVTSQQSNINTSINCNNNMHTNISNNTYIPLQQRESTTHETTKSKYSRLIPENKGTNRHNNLSKQYNGNKIEISHT